jgi:hypothetical protein
MLDLRLKPLIASICVVGLILFLGREATSWASSLAKPGRQTVPLTPPATWTPNVPAAPTAAQPTRPPSADRSGSTGPYPVLALQANPTVLSPEQTSVISVALSNSGNGPLSEAMVTLTQPGLLRLTRSRMSNGTLELGPSQLVWRPGSVAPGETATLELDMVLSAEALPDRQLLVSGTLVWPGGEDLVADMALNLPWALLPATGS